MKCKHCGQLLYAPIKWVASDLIDLGIVHLSCWQQWCAKIPAYSDDPNVMMGDYYDTMTGVVLSDYETRMRFYNGEWGTLMPVTYTAGR
ncbi:MAG: hypothetical protein HRT35_00900 [Algicola sp.]|nr:hypothetical protein [Algicola sp.]